MVDTKATTCLSVRMKGHLLYFNSFTFPYVINIRQRFLSQERKWEISLRGMRQAIEALSMAAHDPEEDLPDLTFQRIKPILQGIADL